MSRVCLPQHDTPEGRATRARHLGVQKASYDWMHVDGLPPFVKGLPEPEKFDGSKQQRFDWNIRGSLFDASVSFVRLLTAKPNELTDYDRYYFPYWKMPSVAERWMSDREFARQRLDGINPFLIRRIREIPAKMPVTDETVAGVLPPRTTLRQLLDEGRLYVVDYEALEGCPIVLGRFLTAAIALFWVNDDDVLMPLAIQLGQSVDQAPVIFTPKDDRWLWLMARSFVASADGAYHELVAHLSRTHLVMETAWVAASRTLPPEHPLHVLLKPHFTDTININYDARTSLIVPGGAIDESIAVGSEGGYWLVDQTWKDWTFDTNDPIADFERRDVGDLPGFHYRDDALRLHRTLTAYVHELLPVFYRSDDDVKGDTELQAWVTELQADDGGQWKKVPGQGARIQTVKQLERLVLRILWTVSCEHAAVNNGQYDQFGYIPNTPGAMYLPPPTTKDPITEGTLVYALPMEKGVDEQLTLVHLLSMPTAHPLGHYPDDFFQDIPKAQDMVDRFRVRLTDDDVAIRERNRTLAVPYTYLQPCRIGRSIAI